MHKKGYIINVNIIIFIGVMLTLLALLFVIINTKSNELTYNHNVIRNKKISFINDNIYTIDCLINENNNYKKSTKIATIRDLLQASQIITVHNTEEIDNRITMLIKHLEISQNMESDCDEIIKLLKNRNTAH